MLSLGVSHRCKLGLHLPLVVGAKGGCNMGTRAFLYFVLVSFCKTLWVIFLFFSSDSNLQFKRKKKKKKHFSFPCKIYVPSQKKKKKENKKLKNKGQLNKACV